jgi:hypothetical protein
VTTTTMTPPRAPSRASLLREVRVALAILAAGLVLGGVWALWAPALAHTADLGEAKVTVDGLLALLGLGAGLVTAVILVVVPGPRPAIRLAVVLGAAVVANLVAAGIGEAARGLRLGAPGVVLLWPLAAAILTALRTLASFVVSPDDDGSPRSGPEGDARDTRFSEPPAP